MRVILQLFRTMRCILLLLCIAIIDSKHMKDDVSYEFDGVSQSVKQDLRKPKPNPEQWLLPPPPLPKLEPPRRSVRVKYGTGSMIPINQNHMERYTYREPIRGKGPVIPLYEIPVSSYGYGRPYGVDGRLIPIYGNGNFNQ